MGFPSPPRVGLSEARPDKVSSGLNVRTSKYNTLRRCKIPFFLLSSLRSISISISISVTLSPPPISGLVFQILVPIQNLHQFKFHHLRPPTLCNFEFERDLQSRVPPTHRITAGDTFDANLLIVSCIHHFSDGFTGSFPVSGIVTELDLPHWSI